MTTAVITSANAASLKRVRRLGPIRLPVRSAQSIGFEPRGTRLLENFQQGSYIRWWNLESPSDVLSGSLELELEPTVALFCGPDRIVCAGPPVAEAATPWRPRLMAFSTADGLLWREETLSAPATGLAVSRDGMLLAFLERGEAFLWDVAAWRRIRGLQGIEGDVEVKACAFSPDSRFAAAAVTDHDREQAFLYLWDLTTDRRPWILPLGFAFAESVAFHPTRPLLVAGSIHEMVVVDVNERRELKRLNDSHHYASNLDFSPDGQLLVSSADGRGFVLHDFETGGLLFSHSDDTDEQTSDAVFSPDGRFIAWAQGDGTVGLWGID